MLQAIRDRVSGIVAGIILGLLAIPFALVGIQNYFTPDPGNVLATVGEEDISVTEYQQSFNQQRRRVQQFMGENFNPSLFEGEIPRREHLESMIDQKLLHQYAVANGIDVPAQELAELIASMPTFQVGGQFDGDQYSRLLSASGVSVAQFEESQKTNLRLNRLLSGVGASSFATAEETNQTIKLQDEKRSIEFFPINAQQFRDSVSISDEEMREYYEANTNSFMTPEQVVVDYLEINATDYETNVDISEQTLLDRYEQQKGRFVTPERRLTSHILLNVDASDEAADATALELAQSLTQRARDGESFDDLAKEFSEDPGSSETGGDLGWVETGVMVAPFEEALFAMDSGAFSDPVKTSFGYHVIWLREIDESHGQEFAEVQEELRREEAQEQSRSVYDDIVRRVTEITYEDTGSLQRAADEVGIEVQTSPAFGRSGGGGIASFSDVSKAAFDDLVLTDGLNSDPLQVEPDHVVVIRLNEHLPSKARPFEEVSEEIRAILLQEKSSEAAKAAADAYLTRIDTGEIDLAAAASEDEQEVTKMEQMSRRDFQLGLPFIEAVFALPAPEAGQPTFHVAKRNNQDWAVLGLFGVTQGDPAAAQEATKQQVEREIASYFSGAEQEHLISLLREKTTITIYEDRL